MKNATVVIVAGPTGSGKTALAIELARLLGGEIISADSRQVYRFMDIGTAKPTPEEQAAAPHHFIDILNPDEEYNAGLFSDQARERIESIIARGRVPIIAGGSGLYIDALVDGMFEGPARDPELRAILESEMELLGQREMFVRLMKVDPEAASRMDPTKFRRVIRALEVFYLTGKPISQLQRELVPLKHPCRFLALRWDRGELYDRINRRVLAMMTNGLLEEASNLLEMGYSPGLNALQTVGYKEAFQHLRGELPLEEMVSATQMNTRRYAKRQLTWFRADDRIEWLDVAEGFDSRLVAEQAVSLLIDSPGGRQPV